MAMIKGRAKLETSATGPEKGHLHPLYQLGLASEALTDPLAATVQKTGVIRHLGVKVVRRRAHVHRGAISWSDQPLTVSQPLQSLTTNGGLR